MYGVCMHAWVSLSGVACTFLCTSKYFAFSALHCYFVTSKQLNGIKPVRSQSSSRSEQSRNRARRRRRKIATSRLLMWGCNPGEGQRRQLLLSLSLGNTMWHWTEIGGGECHWDYIWYFLKLIYWCGSACGVCLCWLNWASYNVPLCKQLAGRPSRKQSGYVEPQSHLRRIQVKKTFRFGYYPLMVILSLYCNAGMQW